MKTAESITPKHPDKMCDRISDAILDKCLEKDINSRVAVEVVGGHGKISVVGELTTTATVTPKDIENIIERIVGKKLEVDINIIKQSPEISRGVDDGGAGDQGIMVGYACRHNKDMVPQEYYLARNLCKFIYKRYPEDGKTQITIDEDDNIKVVVASFNKARREDLENIVKEWLLDKNVDNVKLLINPAGDWSIGQFDADTGLTGRKIVADAYGPQVPVGGGAFSGKDPTKVDRSGAYYARYIATKILKESNDTYEVIVRLAFAIGIKGPVEFSAISRTIDGEISIHNNLEDICVKDIINRLDLKKPIYEKTAEWGAFGNGFNWDK